MNRLASILSGTREYLGSRVRNGMKPFFLISKPSQPRSLRHYLQREVRRDAIPITEGNDGWIEYNL